jgi:hypothetical protein
LGLIIGFLPTSTYWSRLWWINFQLWKRSDIHCLNLLIPGNMCVIQCKQAF